MYLVASDSAAIDRVMQVSNRRTLFETIYHDAGGPEQGWVDFLFALIIRSDSCNQAARRYPVSMNNKLARRCAGDTDVTAGYRTWQVDNRFNLDAEDFPMLLSESSRARWIDIRHENAPQRADRAHCTELGTRLRSAAD